MSERLDLKDSLTNYFSASNATTVQEVVAELYQEGRRSKASEDTKTLALAQAQDQAMEQMERVHALEERVRVTQNSYDELMRSYCNLRDRLLRLRDLSFPCPHCGKNRFQKLADDHVLTGGKEAS